MTQTLKVPDWPGRVTSLSGTFTDRPAKVTNCTVCFPAVFFSSHTVWITIFGTTWIHDTDRPVVLPDKLGGVTNKSLATLYLLML